MERVYWLIERELAGRCGPACAPWEADALYRAGIRAVISLDGTEVRPDTLEQAGIVHFAAHTPMMLLQSETSQRRFLSLLAEPLAFIDRMRTERRPVLVHCFSGWDRTGAVLACHLVAREGLSATAAIERVRQVQPEALQATGYPEAVALFARNHRPAEA